MNTGYLITVYSINYDLKFIILVWNVNEDWKLIYFYENINFIIQNYMRALPSLTLEHFSLVILNIFSWASLTNRSNMNSSPIWVDVSSTSKQMTCDSYGLRHCDFGVQLCSSHWQLSARWLTRKLSSCSRTYYDAVLQIQVYSCIRTLPALCALFRTSTWGQTTVTYSYEASTKTYNITRR